MVRTVCLDKDWKFITERDAGEFVSFGMRKCGAATGPAAAFYHEGLMRSVDLPHDWAVELPPDLGANTGRGGRAVSRYMPLYVSSDGDNHLEVASVGWYRKHFAVEGAEGKRIFLELEGVYRDYTLFVNGIYVDRHTSGYTPAWFDITDQVHPSGDNVVAVRVDASQPEGWWYEGAGIYRHVRLHIRDSVYIPEATTFVKADVSGRVEIASALRNASFEEGREACVVCTVRDADGRVMDEKRVELTVPPHGDALFGLTLSVPDPRLWDVKDPYLYAVSLRLGEGEADEVIPFGFRHVSYDPDRGMFLNGRPIKIRGACVHQDFGGFGIALPEGIARYKIGLLREMGMNAYRSTHHPASEDILRACDEMGMLVLDEVRLFGSSPEALRQLETMVRTHRNHPCIFMWSLGNEEIENDIQSSDFGERMVRTAYRHLRMLDDTRAVTYGANNGCSDRGANAAVDVRGFNYVRNLERLHKDSEGRHLPGYHLDRYHREHPEAVLLGTEECSHFLSRDAGRDDYARGETVATGENTTPGGSTPEGWVRLYESRDFLLGGFIWTGIDYYGEPCPYTDRNLVSSFGAIDLVGLPKNAYHYYRSCWLEEPVLEIMPHWDFEQGQTVRVGVYTNCEQVTLYQNGRKVETRTLGRFDSALFSLTFEPGYLEAEGVRNGTVYRARVETPAEPARLALSARKEGDVVICDVALTDGAGRVCRRADREVSFAIAGGEILGVGNGDPASLEPDKFLPEEELRPLTELYVTEGGVRRPYAIPPVGDRTGVAKFPVIDSVFKAVREEPRHPLYEDEHRLLWQFTTPGEEEREAVFEAEITGAEGYTFLQFERLCGRFEVWLDGEPIGRSLPESFSQSTTLYRSAPYRFPCRLKEGKGKLTVRMSGLNTAPMGIYGGVYLGKPVAPTWRRSTYYGKLRVFVQRDGVHGAPLTLTASAEGVESATLTL